MFPRILSERNYQRMAVSLERWFAKEQRPLPWRTSYDPYHVLVSEVMAQQTRMDVVVKYWQRFIDRFPGIEALADAPEEEVLAAWSGLGYYRRARMLLAAAVDVVERFDGRIPEDVHVLESIPGIGPYTAGAVASIAYDHPVPIVDGNVRRVLARVGGIGDRIGSAGLDRNCRDLARRLVETAGSPRALNQALMELGATLCSPTKPGCDRCPIASDCHARTLEAQAEYPRPKEREKIVRMVVPVYLIEDAAGRIMLLRKNGSRLLERMFRLPGDDSRIDAPVSFEGLVPVRRLGEVRHSITNRRIRFEVWDATVGVVAESPDREVRWVHPRELSTVPHPSWVRKAIALRSDRAD